MKTVMIFLSSISLRELAALDKDFKIMEDIPFTQLNGISLLKRHIMQIMVISLMGT